MWITVSSRNDLIVKTLYYLSPAIAIWDERFHIMKTEVFIEGRGLEELYWFLEDKGLDLDVKYHFNHWLLSAEIAGVKLSGDREDIFAVLLDYYEGRKGKDVVVTIDNKAQISFKDQEIAVLKQQILTPC